MEEKTASEKIIEAVMKLDYGDYITHGQLVKISGIKNMSKYYSIVTKANKTLTTKSKRLKNQHGMGYVVLRPDAYIDEAEKKFKSGSKRVKESMKILAYAPVDLMTEQAQTNYKMIESRVRNAVALITGGLTEIRLINKPKLTLNN